MQINYLPTLDEALTVISRPIKKSRRNRPGIANIVLASIDFISDSDRGLSENNGEYLFDGKPDIDYI